MAWHTQLSLAGRAPFSVIAGGRAGQYPDSLVGEAVFDSEHVRDTLMAFLNDIDPRQPIAETAIDTLARTSVLVELRPSWVAYCDRRTGLGPGAADRDSDICRTWVSGDVARAWPRFAEGRIAFDAAAEAAVRLQKELDGVCGADITVLESRAEALLRGAA
ncbi:hypothetical protein [Streptomyces acidiscabies]|uniref:Uncharacterized protein n=1 Tax=Streptomyces acidiscabies TaxID=42234 RepID=A0AAP6BJ26_9ACTN|nr:hypothetical protein [Streptomyces acidiscabies]MBP5935435.1 hypothetical protein [Streptomyces sp. LBUM 1476]MBZ3916708.1 hypothetical protein [Streptomyces acidiscabies]MDX2965655.1 hypothetical protein [Streptomyces acidiscabies]MDX3024843.1 hypothetical protein [Streptomyces acidiscabies]MDX3795571.1 hypothetical protein [Streptomyces acidiscabies]